ncbi:hypothetical protein DFH07DRAFT_884353 [Mycena maculata]|uniref:Protein-tyrosine-phosphatase n=1 Tax=Mycena maculata TaxID=230809 RepID=A0AAD7J8D5_9AGAR|nr:hypothetical protein DFH07DRAFT_884353 [Mycena maculata]
MDAEHDPHEEHGLRHPPALLASLPALPATPPHSSNAGAVKILSAAQFAAMHTAHIVAHPPDGVLFPFLHGLEGDNAAQNTFFAAGGSAHGAAHGHGGGRGAKRRPPRFRGLVWVVAEEDLPGSPTSSGGGDAREGEDEEFSEEEEDELEDELEGELGMDVDPDVRIVDASPSPPPDAEDDDKIDPHSSATSPPQEHQREVEQDAGPTLLTCTFRPRELLRRVVREAGEVRSVRFFRPARVPDGISLRNFGIQVVSQVLVLFRGVVVGNEVIGGPIYATLSDIVLYSPAGLASRALRALARRVAGAVRRKREERYPAAKTPDAPLEYNVFVLDADARALRAAVPELMMRDAPTPGMHVDGPDAPVAVPLSPDAADTQPNTVDFGQRERDEMRELTRASEILSVFGGARGEGRGPFASAAGAEEDERGREELANTTTASHWRPAVGQVFLGNSGDVPLGTGAEGAEDPFDFVGTNAPAEGMGFDVCVECHEMAPFPSLAHLRAAEEHLSMLDRMWDERVRGTGAGEAGLEGPVRPPPNANAVIHLPFPSAPPNTAQTMNALLPVVAFLERCLRPAPPRAPAIASDNNSSSNGTTTPSSGARRWSTFPTALSPAAFFPSPPPPPPPGTAPRTRSLTSPAPSPAPTLPSRTRPLKVLIYSSDGYTESSPLALTLLMAARRLSLPEAYLELQVAKRRSFFVYPGELGLLRRVEARIGGGEVFAPRVGRRMSNAGAASSTGSLGSAGGAQVMGAGMGMGGEAAPSPAPYAGARPSAKSVSFAPGAVVSPPVTVPSLGSVTRAGRPRARTSPWLPSFGDHQSWFNDPRFDGSFPSRVLPFLYLGNLNHASNAYMLHALGITHVVSVGECALVPPPGHCTSPGETCTSAACRPNHNTNAHFIQGKGPGNQGSLWIEEREGRIKVLDIKGVCDDGIDTLEPQLEPICEWIEKARQEGGHVLVHCRVGVSRSATVTIAYVMKHLSLPLVDAYLIVRSRRLSVLIQPNMRLLYNLCGWEIKLAKERAGEDAQRLRKELARTLTWPYLSKEVHALNEKYLH